MRKMILIMLVIIVECCYLSKKSIPVFIEKIDLKLKENEIAIINLYFNKNKGMVIKTVDTDVLLLIDLKDKNKLLANLDDFGIEVDYLLSFDDCDIPSDDKQILNDSLEINGIKFYKNNNNITINYQNHNFCILDDNYIDDSNNCHYIYWDNPSGEIETNYEPELILYQKLNEDFLEKTYDKWIDTYYVDPAYYTILKLNSISYNLINVPIKD